MPLYEATVPQLTKMLSNLALWIDDAEAHAKTKGFEPDLYLTFRLAPDQYAFVRQVQAACDSAKFAAARTTGKEPPKHPDDETTLDQLRARIRSVVDYLGTFTPADFEGAEVHHVKLSFMPGKAMTGVDYVHQMALPNFYFHLTHAYAILRHNGVELGKMKFMGPIDLHDVT